MLSAEPSLTFSFFLFFFFFFFSFFLFFFISFFAFLFHTGSYAVCVPTGDNVVSDTINGFLMNMDKSVDVFAKKIQADPKLAGGFNAVGFSQVSSSSLVVSSVVHCTNSSLFIFIITFIIIFIIIFSSIDRATVSFVGTFTSTTTHLSEMSCMSTVLFQASVASHSATQLLAAYAKEFLSFAVTSFTTVLSKVFYFKQIISVIQTRLHPLAMSSTASLRCGTMRLLVRRTPRTKRTLCPSISTSWSKQ